MSSSGRKKNRGAAAAVAAIAVVGLGGGIAYALSRNGTGQTVDVAVRSVDQNGTEHPGHMVTILENEAIVSSNPTPVTFRVTKGRNYVVVIEDMPGHTFLHWQDNVTTRARAVIATQNINLTAVFQVGDGGGGTTATVSITSHATGSSSGQVEGYFMRLLDSNMQEIATGFTPVAFQGLQVGQRYFIEATLAFGDATFARWDDGSTNNVREIPSAPEAGLNWQAYYNIGGGGGGGGTGPITAMAERYWHYLEYSTTSIQAKVILNYTGSSGIVDQPIIGVMEIYSLAGDLIKRDTDEFTGKLSDNLPLTTNISPAPGNIRVRYFMAQGSSTNMISPPLERQMTLGQTSDTYHPAAPASASDVAVRMIYGHYRTLADGTYQLEVNATYRPGSTRQGTAIRLACEVRVNGQTALLGTFTGPAVVAETESTIMVKGNMSNLGAPGSLDLTMYAVDDATRNRITATPYVFVRFLRDGLWP